MTASGSGHIHEDDASAPASLLRESHLKATRPRQAILRYLMTHHGPFTMEEIRASSDCGCDLVTVYRGVAALEKAGLIVRCDFGDGVQRFERVPGRGGGHHHHVICRSCRRVEVVDVCLSARWKGELRGTGYSDISHTLEFFGLCPACQKHRRGAE